MENRREFCFLQTQFRVLVKIGDQVKSFNVEKNSFTVGRSKNADLQIPYDYLSNLHFRFDEIGNNRFVITDLGSTNGTCLKNNKLEPNKSSVYQPGEEILIKVQNGVRIKILPQVVENQKTVTKPVVAKENVRDKEALEFKKQIESAKEELKKLQSQIESEKKELTKISKMAKINQEAYLVEKESRRNEMLKIVEDHKKEFNLLKEDIEKLTLEKMDENLKIVLVKEELTKLTNERNELKDVVETQFKALKLMNEKALDATEMLRASESSMQSILGNLNAKSLEYSKVSESLESARAEYEKLKHNTDILNAETKKLVEIYKLEKEQFDQEMEQKRKSHMEELNKQLESFNDQAIKKKAELNSMQTEFEIRQLTYAESLRKFEQKEKEKSDLELKRQTAAMTTELLYYRTELKSVEKIYKTKMLEIEKDVDQERLNKLKLLEGEIGQLRERRLTEINNDTSELDKVKTEKNEAIEQLRSLRAELNNLQQTHKEFLDESERQRNEIISQAENDTEREIRKIKYKKAEEVSDQISNLINKDLMFRRGRALDDEYIEKSSIAIKRLILEKMMESNEVNTERTRQLVLGDELKKFRPPPSARNNQSFVIAASAATILFVMLCASLLYPEAELKTKKFVLNKAHKNETRIPASR